MQTLWIQSNDAGQRLDKFLQKSLRDAPLSLIYKYLRKKRVKVNGKKGDASYRLLEGDRLDLYIGDDFFQRDAFVPSIGDVTVVYEDNNLLIMDKPPLLPCQPNAKGDTDTLLHKMQTYLYEKGDYRPQKEYSFAPALCNRLDTNTRGLVIGAKTALALRGINEAIRERKITKKYACVTNGVPKAPSGLLEGYIVKDKTANRSIIVDTRVSGALPVQTKYRVLATKENYALLDIELLTGRSHQIRAHMASIGCPIRGDKKYGGSGGAYQALCAYALTFHDLNGELFYLNGRTVALSPFPFQNEFF